MSFAADVRAGLSHHPKTLAAKYFYDELGSTLFEAICKLPEYYLTRAETEILEHHADEIVDCVGTPIELIELGSGSAMKTRYLIDAAFRRQPTLQYRPIDISKSALDESTSALREAYPNLSVDPHADDYLQGLRRLRRDNGQRALVLFLGSNVGNFDPAEAERTLHAVSSTLRNGDAVLLGADLKKDPAILHAAYDDPLGVTAAFNKNILLRINRELGGHFDLAAFEHRAVWSAPAGRVEMLLVSTQAQRVPIDRLGMSVVLEAGETIHTESSYKYDAGQIETLARATGFEVVQRWMDSSGGFSSNLLKRA